MSVVNDKWSALASLCNVLNSVEATLSHTQVNDPLTDPFSGVKPSPWWQPPQVQRGPWTIPIAPFFKGGGNTFCWGRIGFVWVFMVVLEVKQVSISLSLSLSLHPEWPCFPKRIVYGQNPISQSCQNTAICQQGLKRVRTEKSIWSVLFTVHGCMSLVLPPVSSLSLVRRSFIREKAKHLIPFYSCLFSGGR